MNKLVVAISGVLVIGALVTAFAIRPTEPAEATSSGGTYVTYSAAALDSAEGRVFLFFHAPWCPSCEQLKKRIDHDGVPAGVTILEVDFDTALDLRERYDVDFQTTFVEVDHDGTELQQFLAYNTPGYDSIIALI